MREDKNYDRNYDESLTRSIEEGERKEKWHLYCHTPNEDYFIGGYRTKRDAQLAEQYLRHIYVNHLFVRRNPDWTAKK
jgi:hypothetical protein